MNDKLEQEPVYIFPKPNLYSLRRLFDKFIKDLEREIKPAGFTVSHSGSTPSWNTSPDLFDLKDTMQSLSFFVDIVRYKADG